VTVLLAILEDRRLGLAALGALAVTVGSALPWIRVPQPLAGTATGYGLQDDGKITILLGVLALGLVLAYVRLRQRDLVIGAALAGIGAAGFAAAYLADLNRNAARVMARILTGGVPIDAGAVAEFPARAGPGPWVVIGGAALLAIAAGALTLRAGETTEPAPRSSG
jgi:hypothetical protein